MRLFTGVLYAAIVSSVIYCNSLSASQTPAAPSSAEAVNASIKTANGGTLVAGRVAFPVDALGPFELSGKIAWDFSGVVVRTQGPATYDPTKNQLQAGKVEVEIPATMSSPSISCRGNRLVVVFPDGTEIEADAMCIDGKRYFCRGGQVEQETHQGPCT